MAHEAMIDKMIGDEVMALFIPSATESAYRSASVRAAEEIMREVGYGSGEEPWPPLGIGINAGLAHVGKVGTDAVNDFTALGDTVSSAARLQTEAAAGEIVMSKTVYDSVANHYPELEQRRVEVRCRDEAITVRVIQPERLRTA